MAKKHGGHEEGGRERYIITYADLITLLLVLFILLFAVSSIDVNKYAALAYALTEGPGKTPGAMPGEKPIFDEPGQSVFDAGGYANTQNPVKMFDYDNISDEIAAMAEELDLEFESRGVGSQGKKTGGADQAKAQQQNQGNNDKTGQGLLNEIGNLGNPNNIAQDQGQMGKTGQEQGALGQLGNQLGLGQDVNLGKDKGQIGNEDINKGQIGNTGKESGSIGKETGQGQDTKVGAGKETNVGKDIAKAGKNDKEKGQLGNTGTDIGNLGKDVNTGAGKDVNLGKDKAKAGKNDKEKGQLGNTGTDIGNLGKDANIGAGKDVNLGKDKALLGKDDKDIGQKGKTGLEKGSIGKNANELGQGKDENIGKDKGKIGDTGTELGQKGKTGEDLGQIGDTGNNAGQLADTGLKSGGLIDLGETDKPAGLEGSKNPLGNVKAGIRVVATARGLEIRLTPSDVLFYSGSASLTPQAIKVINRLAQIIMKYDNNHSILVEGHTDSDKLRPGSRYRDNFELSTARAYSVLQRLAYNGIAVNRMGLAGYGEYHPVASNKTEEGKRANRRVVIVLLNPQIALPPTQSKSLNQPNNESNLGASETEPKGILMY